MDLKIIFRKRDTAPAGLTADLTPKASESVWQYHRSFPEYTCTPLRSLTRLAEECGVSSLLVKDESFRFGLNAFKVLGGSYAIGRLLGELGNIPEHELSFAALTDPALRQKTGELTFITATDGNHGRGVAWTAARLGYRSVVYMPRGTAQERLDNIRLLGSDASITELVYDDAVRKAFADGAANGWPVIQDTAWPGYTEIPRNIMRGYTTIGCEILQQLKETDAGTPTHIFLQAGVGTMAAGMAGFFTEAFRSAKNPPKVIVVEPDSADCIFRTAAADDGQLHAVTEEMNTIMAGLACGEPCTIAWDILRCCADACISMPDRCAADGMRILGCPLPGDERVIAGESGASGFGAAMALLRDPALRAEKEALGLDADSRILCISTEGATDRANYRRIVWDGAWGC